MSETAITVRSVQFALRTGVGWLRWPLRQAAGIVALERDVKSIQIHLKAVTDVLTIMVSSQIQNLEPEQRERILGLVANYRLIGEGLGSIVPKGNPLSKTELEELRWFANKAEQRQSFTPEEAHRFKELAEKTAKDHPSEDWAGELLKLGLFIFALYALAKPLSTEDGQSQ